MKKLSILKKYFVSLAIFLILPLGATSKEYKINGIVYDESKNPLPGVNVVEKGTTNGTVTDINGKYILYVSDSVASLVFSFIGFIQEEIKINKSTGKYDLTMIADIVSLDEVVVIGYGVVKKCDITSSVTSVKSTSGYPVFYSSSYAQHGILTAGEINDYGKWKLWQDIAADEFISYSRIWKMKPLKRFSVIFQTKQGFAIPNAQVRLMQFEDTLWNTKTDNTGKAELWAEVNDTSYIRTRDLTIIVEYNGKQIIEKNVKPFHKGMNIITSETDCISNNNIDIAFIVDATGSMGDEINFLKAELNHIMERLKDTLPENIINLGCVFYRDQGDVYLTKKIDISQNIDKVIDFIKENGAGGGGDTPEAVDEALEVTVNELSWSDSALAKIAFLILDAPPHEDPEVIRSLNRVIAQAARKGIRIVPVTCSGIDKSTEFLMRSIALYTNGTYVFLTDDSGVGDKHIKPTTDEYKVELLNDLIFRLIIQYSSSVNCIATGNTEIADTLIIQSFQIEYPLDTIAEPDILKNPDDTEKEKIFGEPVTWKCYPNPTTGIVNIESGYRIKRLFVSDISGKIILRHNANGEIYTTLDISNYPIGTYFINYEYDTDSWMKGKIVLTR